MTKEDILKRLTNHFKDSKIDVQDLTGSSNHYSILVISNVFQDMTLINRHKKIYNIFQNEMTLEIHALQIKTFTFEEWTQKNI
tara:strand:- start:1125 stop:1373 length:249 start_codon:yes stop_codon:yes gene_type:complete